jgi:hypothetical protein
VLIDCDTCAVRGPACGDCVVTVLLAAPPVTSSVAPPDETTPDPVELDAAEQAAIAVLAQSGLVPPLRLVPGGGDGAPRVSRPTHGGRDEAEEGPRTRRNNSA